MPQMPTIKDHKGSITGPLGGPGCQRCYAQGFVALLLGLLWVFQGNYCSILTLDHGIAYCPMHYSPTQMMAAQPTTI